MNISRCEAQKPPVLTPYEEPDIFDSNPEAKEFKKFFISSENEEMNDLENQKKIRNNIKMKIPEMKNLEDLKKLYIKTFLQRKK